MPAQKFVINNSFKCDLKKDARIAQSHCVTDTVLTQLLVTYEHTILLEWILSAQFSVLQNFNLFPCFTVLIKFFFSYSLSVYS